MTLLVAATAIAAICIVNSQFHGEFFAGLMLIVAPVLLLSFLLPRILPVRCPNCGARMRFRIAPGGKQPDRYAFVCQRCAEQHEWEGASSPASLGD